MTDTQNNLPPNTQLAYQSEGSDFGGPVSINTVMFSSRHPSTTDSHGDNLYQVAIQKNGTWELQPVQVKWPDDNKQLVAGLHLSSAEMITGIRLYHVGNSTLFRKPDSINASTSVASMPHAEEIPLPVSPVWQNIAIWNPKFEEAGLWHNNAYASYIGWDIDLGASGYGGEYEHHEGVRVYDNGGNSRMSGGDISIYIAGTESIEQTLSEKFNSANQYRLSVDTKQKDSDIKNEYLQLWAGDTKLGEKLVSTSSDWTTTTFNVDGATYSSLTGQPLKIKMAPGSGDGAVVIDNFNLQKLTQAMSSFAAPDGMNATPDIPTVNQNVAPMLTSNVV
ncbi:hypothetical protein [Enterobacter sp. A103]|uniref:hypothetical protein n=1 Tax=Enterobacter sp. A103 TaxID=3102785 RepID=UPI002ACA16A9|nr:hypothetical protein [Enterobacter sp. A103]MDZ5641670.1 hypothetical protein [Enterobacter sp. A103]